MKILPKDPKSTYKCKQCGKVLSRNHYKRHEMMHQGVKRFACSYCDKKFTQSGNLKTHERRHTGVKPYLCSCSMAFVSKKELLDHLRRFKSHSQVFPCMTCSKVFKFAKDRNKHRLDSHPELVTEHVCSICFQDFAKIRLLSLHVTNHHGGNAGISSTRMELDEQSRSSTSDDEEVCTIVCNTLKAFPYLLSYEQVKEVDQHRRDGDSEESSSDEDQESHPELNEATQDPLIEQSAVAQPVAESEDEDWELVMTDDEEDKDLLVPPADEEQLRQTPEEPVSKDPEEVADPQATPEVTQQIWTIVEGKKFSVRQVSGKPTSWRLHPMDDE